MEKLIQVGLQLYIAFSMQHHIDGMEINSYHTLYIEI